MSLRIIFAISLMASLAVRGENGTDAARTSHLMPATSARSVDIPLLPASNDAVRHQGFPPIGKWMLDGKGEVAHWLGYRIKGQTINEPINLVLRVDADSERVAKDRLRQAFARAGFRARKGHSNGYQALIDGQRYPQVLTTISNGTFLLPNNHGRVFGPVWWNGQYVFTAALSRENVTRLKKVVDGKAAGHTYSSFNRARDGLVRQLVWKAGAKSAGTIYLENRIANVPGQTTGDHDGYAFVIDLVAGKK